MEKEKKTRKPSKKEVPESLLFEYGEIRIQLSKITDREDFDRRFKGKLSSTDINKAWIEAEKQRSKYK